MKRMLFIIFALLLLFQSQAYSADQWDVDEPKGDTDINDYDAEIPENNAALERLLYNYRNGLRIEYSSASALTLGTGEVDCVNSSGDGKVFRRMSSETTVDWDDIDTGSEEASDTYYMYAVADTDITGVTFKISLSSTSPTGATYYRKLGSFDNDASSNITEISNLGEESNYYDSGWFAIALAGTYAKTHNLGTTRLVSTVLYSTDGTNANAYTLLSRGEVSGSEDGIQLNNFTQSQVTLQAGQNRINITYDSDGVATYQTSGHARIIMTTIE